MANGEPISRRDLRQLVRAATGASPVRASDAKQRCSTRRGRALAFPTVKDANGTERAMSAILLRMDSGDEFAVTNTMFTGSYGSVSLSMRRRDETVWAVKRVHLLDSARSKTKTTTLPNVIDEIGTLRAMHQFEDAAWLDNGKVYIAMPLISINLCDAISRVRLTENQHREFARRTVRCVAQEGCRLHCSGRVHLDIKPENIFYDSAAWAQLGDYGLTRRCGERGAALQASPGSPGYVAPEVVMYRTAYHSSDVWSLAMTWMDFFADREESPFFVALGRDEAANTRAFEASYADFAVWRSNLFREGRSGDKAIALGRIRRRGGTAWDTYFNSLKQRDPEACAFMLERMLDLEPHTRAKMGEVHAFLRVLKRCTPTLAQFARSPVDSVLAAITKRADQKVAKMEMEDLALPDAKRAQVAAALRRYLRDTDPQLSS